MVGNCLVKEKIVEKIRINKNNKPELTKVTFYSASSVVPGEFESNFESEDKNGYMYYLKSEKYCNLSLDELEKMRLKEKKIALDNKVFGSCELNLTSDGVPVSNACPADFQYQVLRSIDKETVINLCFQNYKKARAAMVQQEYCHLNEEGVAEYFKNQKLEMIKTKKFGNCEILLNEAGEPERQNCQSEFPFKIVKTNNREAADNSCYPNFKQAQTSMKSNSYCNLTKEELEAFEQKEREAFEASLKKGKCQVENIKTSLLARDKKTVWCSEKFPWFVSYDQARMLTTTCFSSHTTGVDEINKNPACSN